MDKNIKDIVLTELEDLKERIAENIRTTGQNASGNTVLSLKVKPTETGALLEGRSPFGTLETGRKKGKVPKSFSKIIMQWMDDKGITARPIPYKRKPSERWQPKYTEQERGTISLAGAIAHKIKTKGTSLYRAGGIDTVYSKEIPKTIEAIKDKVMIEVVKHIKLN